jgi:hypothetical protein
MFTRSTWAVTLCVVAALAFFSASRVRAITPVADRFSFAVTGAEKLGPTGTGRMEIVVNQWSGDADRGRVFAALEEGPEKFANAIWNSYMAGYMNWPGYLHYTIRYAHKTTSPNGEDLVLVTDQPVSLFWEETAPKADGPRYHVIQLHLDKNGKGEGKIGTRLTPNKNTKTFVLDGYAAQPALLADVRREAATS